MGEKPEGDQPTPDELVRNLYEDAERRAASAMEGLVQRDSFGELLARTTENAMALTRIGFGVFDLVVRNMRIAGRSDIARLGRQLARTEDKLERVLQEVERLRDELAAERTRPNGRAASSSSRSTSSNGRRKSASRSRSRSS